MYLVSIIILAYLIGCIPPSIWVGKMFYGIDIREHGSGNAGATNILRVLGKLPALIVLILDVLKGTLAVSLSQDINTQFFLGLFVIIGHIFPVFAGFRGGKGVSTTFGCLIYIVPYISIVLVIIFAISLLVNRMTSLSVIITSLSFPLISYLMNCHPTIMSFSILILFIIIQTHRQNIYRIIDDKEPKLF
jgi:glycerol-3-phosphate acyltransferase PlsY